MSGGAGQALVDEMVAVNLAAVRARIAAAAATVGRDAAVTLVAVTKAQPDVRWPRSRPGSACSARTTCRRRRRAGRRCARAIPMSCCT